MPSSGMSRYVALVRTEISEQPTHTVKKHLAQVVFLRSLRRLLHIVNVVPSSPILHTLKGVANILEGKKGDANIVKGKKGGAEVSRNLTLNLSCRPGERDPRNARAFLGQRITCPLLTPQPPHFQNISVSKSGKIPYLREHFSFPISFRLSLQKAPEFASCSPKDTTP
jgi:hypothetical protein